MFRLILATIIGYTLGKERKKNDKAGGSRTMAIVAMASCLIALLTQEIALLNPDTHNFSRLMAYGIASIGFLGAGIISHHGQDVDGLTTASTIWCLVPISYMIGLRCYFYGIVASLILYIILESKYWHQKGDSK